MKPTAIVVNTARGHLIDKQAFLTALSEGGIAGAGLDAFQVEPVEADDPILSARNVVLSPHIAGQSYEVRRAALLQVVANVENFLKGTPTFVVAS
jgi:phosphoglycerate dehydrogenase-like enzyme